MPNFNTKHYCAKDPIASAIPFDQCVAQEAKYRELLLKVIEYFPAGDLDGCVNRSRKNGSESYLSVSTCILTDPRLVHGTETNVQADAPPAASQPLSPKNGAADTAAVLAAPDSPPKTPKISESPAQDGAPPNPTEPQKAASSESGSADKPLVQAKVRFEHDMGVGASGPDVRALQVFLNANGFQVADSGPGSPGNEADLFGEKTKSAVVKFQSAHALTASGYLGAQTRKYINHIASAQPSN